MSVTESERASRHRDQRERPAVPDRRGPPDPAPGGPGQPGRRPRQPAGAGRGRLLGDPLPVLRRDAARARQQGRLRPAVLEPGTLPASPGINFHASIYAARPDVHCVIHTHAKNMSVLSTTGVAFDVYYDYAALLLDEVVPWTDDPNLVPSEEGDLMVAELGGRKALLMGHHGSLHVGDTLERGDDGGARHGAVRGLPAGRDGRGRQAAGRARPPRATATRTSRTSSASRCGWRTTGACCAATRTCSPPCDERAPVDHRTTCASSARRRLPRMRVRLRRRRRRGRGHPARQPGGLRSARRCARGCWSTSPSARRR